jgi:predicted DNA-binding transcriptional regulator YafY
VPIIGTECAMVAPMKIRQRQDELVRLMRRHGHISVDELAANVGVSRRTVLRDIGALRDQGFVIDAESGKGGGIRLDTTSIQMTARLNVEEVFALLLSVTAMRATRFLPFSELADRGLAKIEKSLPRERVRELRGILERLYIGPPASAKLAQSASDIDPALLPAFERSFVNRRRLRFDYINAQSRVSNRDVEPQAMLVLPPIWYIVAYDDARGDFRHFRMDRIRTPEVAEAGFRRRQVVFEKGVCPFSEMVEGTSGAQE